MVEHRYALELPHERPGSRSPCGGSRWQDRVLAEVAPDGTVSAQEFAVPDGSVLVVTDIDWGVYESPTSFIATGVLRFAVYLGGYGADAKVFETGRITGADLAAAGVWLGSASMTAGSRVGPGVPVCPIASSMSSTSGSTNSVRSLNLRGYLIKSK